MKKCFRKALAILLAVLLAMPTFGVGVLAEPEQLPTFTVTYTDGVTEEVLFEDQQYQVVLSGATPAFSGGIPTREGYTFLCWTPAVAEFVTSDAIYTATWEPVVPSSATPSSAIPSSATPSSAIPSSATPSSAIPSSATPSSAIPSSAIPSSAIPSSAIPSSAVYQIKYTDGTGAEAIFADQIYEAVESNATPVFSGGTPTREGYIFLAWAPEVAEIVTSDAIYTAVWAKSYTVTYTDGVDAQTVFEDQRYTVIESSATPVFSGGTPAREDYVFLGWSPEVAAAVTSDAVYTAIWKQVIFTVTYNDGVEGEEIFPDQSYRIGEGEQIPSFAGTPSRPGYAFFGWNMPAVPVTENVVITAKWQALPTYTVTYRDGVGSAAFAEQTYSMYVGGATPVFSGGIPQRVGYVFAGWTPEVVATVTADTVYTATWTKAYSVTYTDGVPEEEIFADQVSWWELGTATPAFSSGIPQRKGYVFEGWTPAVAPTVTADAIYTAVWKRVYSVTYTDGVEGEELFPDQTYVIESGAQIPAFVGTPTRAGYLFMGWLLPELPLTDDAVIVPNWQALPTFTVTYRDGVGSTAFAEQTYSMYVGGPTPVFSGGIPQRPGYLFAGWTPEIAQTVNYDAVYTATWQKAYTVTYTDGVEDLVLFEDRVYTVVASSATPVFSSGVPEREGYIFLGWTPEVAEIVTSDAIYTAMWEKKPYPQPTAFTVTYYASEVSSAAVSVASGACAVKPAVPAKEGCGFAGWYLDAEYTQKYDFDTPVTADTALYARFFLWGDVNDDGDVTALDADLVLDYIMEVDNPAIVNILAGMVTEISDCVSARDGDTILDYIMEVIEVFPMESCEGYEFDIENIAVIAPEA